MKTVRRLAMMAGLVMAAPAMAADLPVPPLIPQPTRASFPAESAPLPAPTTVIPTIPDVAKEAPPAVPPPAYRDPTQAEPDASPTWLERFGPFLKSQLDMIFTGSITPPEEERCEPGRKHGAQRTADHCRAAKPRRSRATRPPPSVVIPAPAPPDMRSERARRRTTAANAAAPVPGTVTVIAPLPRVQPLY